MTTNSVLRSPRHVERNVERCTWKQLHPSFKLRLTHYVKQKLFGRRLRLNSLYYWPIRNFLDIIISHFFFNHHHLRLCQTRLRIFVSFMPVSLFSVASNVDYPVLNIFFKVFYGLQVNTTMYVMWAKFQTHIVWTILLTRSRTLLATSTSKFSTQTCHLYHY